MSTRTLKILFWSAVLTLVMACGSSLATPFPTSNPEQINMFIAQTADAASTQTAAAMPTSTPTATFTPTRNTGTPTPTFTSTVIFILSSPTKQVPPTLIIIGGGSGSGSGGSGGSTSESNYACQILSVNPANGTSMNPRNDFDTVWHVKNIGKKGWDRNSVDFIYLSGAKINKISGYDLSKDVDSGQTIDLGVDMVAPKASGTYTTTWTLSVSGNNFCNMAITIVVK